MSDSKNKRSKIWKHFTIVGNGRAKCSYCNKVLSFCVGTTVNLTRHLNTLHTNISCQKITYGDIEIFDASEKDQTQEISDFADMPSTSSQSTSQNIIEYDMLNVNSEILAATNISYLKNKKSKIWKHFTIVDNGRAKCSYCNKILSFCGGATGNLSRHIKSVHKGISIQEITYGHLESYVIPAKDQTANVLKLGDILSTSSTSQIKDEDHKERSDSKNPILSTSILQIQDVITNSCRPIVNHSKPMKLDEQLIRFIVKGYHPFKIVEEDEFKNFVSMLCPSYKIPDNTTISRDIIPEIYSSVKNEIKTKLLEVEDVCLTIERWTSINNQSFITITVHFIDNDHGKMYFKSNLLDSYPLNERHTVKNISKHLQFVTDEFGLSTKIACIVSENSENITAAIRMNDLKFFPCFAHTLNLIIQSAIHEIKVQILKVKSIVHFFKSNYVALSKLKDMQNEMGLSEIELKQDVEKRWNSTYDMMSRILIIKNVIVDFLAINEPILNTVLPSDWDILQKSVEILKIFNDITEEVSAEKSVSISKVILFVNSMKRHLQKFSTDNSYDQPEVIRLLTKLISGVEERFKNVELHELTTQATFLDPRFKKYGFSSLATYEATLNNIQSEVASFSIENSPERLTSRIDYSETEKKSAIWEDFDNSVENVLSVENQPRASIIEIDKYINEPLIRRTEDPLKWWEERKNIYPRLYLLMKRQLCIVATAVSGERIFTKAAETISEKRSRLKPSDAANILFLNYNL